MFRHNCHYDEHANSYVPSLRGPSAVAEDEAIPILDCFTSFAMTCSLNNLPTAEQFKKLDYRIGTSGFKTWDFFFLPNASSR
jgi:hypothetical protein